MNAFFRLVESFFRMFIIIITIAPWEQAVRTRMGKHVKKLNPGWAIKLPFIDVIYRQSIRLRRAFIATQTLSTKDGKTLVTGGSLAYQIKDIEKLYQTLHHAEEVVMQAAAAAIAGRVFALNASEVHPEEIAAHVTEELKGQFEQYGLSDVSVNITDFAFLKVFRLVQDYRMCSGDTLNTQNGQTQNGVTPAY